MGEVNVIINGISYGIACDQGQESRVQQLGRYVDQRMAEVSHAGANNKAQQMVLTALLLADEVFDLKDHLNHAANANQELQRQPKQTVYQGMKPSEEKEITSAISALAAKVEKLSKRVAKS